jgi:hypothetical protein
VRWRDESTGIQSTGQTDYLLARTKSFLIQSPRLEGPLTRATYVVKLIHELGFDQLGVYANRYLTGLGEPAVIEVFVPFASATYQWLLIVLLFSRAMDFLSTWIATPNLVLEGNPIAKKLGWRWGIIINLGVCLLCATWPFLAIVLTTTSLLVAARNLQSAWLMRIMGEQMYRHWISQHIIGGGRGLYLLCILAQSALIACVGIALVSFSENRLAPFSIGIGIVTYALVVAVFTIFAVWRLGR